jgi:hypothetical protein
VSRSPGFTVVELLVATAIVLVLTGGLLALVEPGPSGSKARAAAIDIQQRLRAATEVLGADLEAAGTGPVNGVRGQPFGAVVASVLPFRVGSRGDPPGTARPDALTVLAAPGVSSGTHLADAWFPGGGPANLALSPGCPAGDASCGLRADAVVLLLDGRGQADLFRVESVAGSLLTLVPRGITSGRAFPAGATVVPVTVVSYYFKPGATGEAGQLTSGDGDASDMPLVDHVTQVSFQLLGEPRPPILAAGPGPARASYGPAPPPPLEDDPRDAWPMGENCTFVATAFGQVSRLPSLLSGTGLVPLSAAVLTDGPWCPDALAPGRYDADLFRVRAVRVTLRLEASWREARGADLRLFAHPGASRARAAAAADQEVVFDVVPRALQRGR